MPNIADIYSYIDSLKRRGSDFIQNPGTSLQQMVGYGNDRAREYNQALSEASKERGYGPNTEKLSQILAESYGPTGMTLWHGSPHVLTKFDLSKIGTGEGAQAFGHGIYLAEHPDVAKTYVPRDPAFEKKILAKYNIAEKQGKYSAMQVYEDLLVHKTPEEIEENLKEMTGTSLSEAKNALKMAKPLYEKQAGSLYKVDLPDEHIEKMLDYDAPLSKQHPEVKKALEKFDPDTYHPQGSDYDPNETGSNTYARLAGVLNVKDMSPLSAEEKASNWLRENGIPGIKYLDERSRNTENGTRNFVLFDPNLATVTERNSVSIPINDIHSQVEEARKNAVANPNDTRMWNDYMSLRKQRDALTRTTPDITESN